MTAASPADWAAFLSLGTAVSAAAAIPFLLWVDADYLLVADWQPLADRVLAEVDRARHAAREARQQAAVTAAALLLLLATPHTQETR